MITAVPLTVPLRAVIVTVPSPTEATKPVGLTVAILVLLDDQVKVALGITVPPVALV